MEEGHPARVGDDPARVTIGNDVAEQRGRSAGLAKAIAHGLFAFVRTYLLKLGFLDGRHGLMLAIYNAEYAYYKYVKLMFMQSPPRRPEFPA